MTAASQRREGLDSLRLLAILAVLFDHYVNPEGFKPGTLSVRFFLLISGFLITRTLINYISSNRSDNIQVIKSFYGRRALRIWPLYYAMLLIMLALGWISVKQLLLHSAFLTNFAQAWLNDWDLPWYLAHVWTLCVQEQYYLLWPMLFLTLGERRWMFLLAIIAAAVFFRVGMWVAGRAEDVAVYTLPLASFDALAIGSLIALYREQLTGYIKHPLACIIAFFIGCFAIYQFVGGFIVAVILPTIWLIPLSILMLAVFENRLGRLGSPLKWRPLVFFGRISLGIYLLHLPIAHALFQWSPPWLMALVSGESFTAFTVLTTATLVTATASWLLFEKPLQRFRIYLPYRRPK